MSWIIATDKLLDGVSICNSLDTSSFEKLVDYAYLNAFGSESEKSQKPELQNTDSLIMGKQLNLAIKTITYVLRRLMLFIASPETILDDLTQKLQMNNDKAEILINSFWMVQTKSVVDSLNTDKELVDVQWNLKVDLSSSTQQKSRVPVGILRLKTGVSSKNVNLEMGTEDLINLFRTLENVQDELDLLNKTK